ncbi:DeoR/GlpR family DNA-binding transcription regulator [Paenibacillus sp. V4I5]|uniref:DeoR/GlpR family DNA-binding transcription regulator n=1 Tax=Paenibacillus sp. V4I5 TaxID=3042306 RepID=UPI0027906F88|nr:DeoR/GlpR family DNA-binding transcription regulator [Paenibacillus sp. V4I5]MDQ0913917.1 DeoR/GlpR family transcriptional regulator of sugar metabolism [Paenibacillus sp. V4I5]
MLPIQRRHVISEYLARHGGATIKDLSNQFGVSEMTIRRDFELLEQQGLVARSHGGAIYVDKLIGEPALPEKQSRNPEVKERLAAYAAERFVSDGDVLIVEGGTTVSRMAAYLKHEGLTLMTNGLDALQQLRSVAGTHTVLCCGGVLREPSGTFVGPVAEAFFSQYHARTAFLSSLSFTVEAGFTDPNMMDTQVKKTMIQSAARTIMLLDSSKIGNRSFATVAQLNEVSVLITDSGVSEQVREACELAGVELHVV